jgi:hypothetical protein
MIGRWKAERKIKLDKEAVGLIGEVAMDLEIFVKSIDRSDLVVKAACGLAEDRLRELRKVLGIKRDAPWPKRKTSF